MLAASITADASVHVGHREHLGIGVSDPSRIQSQKFIGQQADWLARTQWTMFEMIPEVAVPSCWTVANSC